MAGLLDFALGFGANAAGGYAQAKAQEIQSRSEEVRMRNLERLRAQYRKEEMAYASQLRREEAEEEAGRARTSAQSPIGKILIDRGFAPGTPEWGAEYDRMLAVEQEQARSRSRSGNTTPIILANGAITEIDNSELGNLPEGAAVFNELGVHEEKETGIRFYRGDNGITYRQTRRGWTPTDARGAVGTDTNSPEATEPPSRTTSSDSAEPLREVAVNALMPQGEITDPGAGVGPIDFLYRFVANRPGLSNLLASEEGDARTRANQFLLNLEKQYINAFSFNSGEGRVSNFDAGMARDQYPGKNRGLTSERAMFEAFEQDLQGLRAQRAQAENALEQHEQIGMLSPSQVTNARHMVRELGSVIDSIEGMLDARIASTARIDNNLIWNMTDQELANVNPETLNQQQRYAVYLRNRYKNGR